MKSPPLVHFIVFTYVSCCCHAFFNTDSRTKQNQAWKDELSNQAGKKSITFLTTTKRNLALQNGSSSTSISSGSDLKPMQQQQQQEDLIQSLVQQISEAGTDGTKATEEVRKSIIDTVDQIQEINCDTNMTSVPLMGEHVLLYTDTPNTPQYIGPFKGKTTQRFLNESTFQNVLSLGPLSLAINADRKVMDGSRIKLLFKGLDITLFGKNVVEKEMDAKGVWKIVYCGEALIPNNKGLDRRVLLRVMKTPNLYILAKDLEE